LSENSEGGTAARDFGRGLGGEIGFEILGPDIPSALAKPDTKVEMEIRGRRFAAVVVPKPINRKS